MTSNLFILALTSPSVSTPLACVLIHTIKLSSAKLFAYIDDLVVHHHSVVAVLVDHALGFLDETVDRVRMPPEVKQHAHRSLPTNHSRALTTIVDFHTDRDNVLKQNLQVQRYEVFSALEYRSSRIHESVRVQSPSQWPRS